MPFKIGEIVQRNKEPKFRREIVKVIEGYLGNDKKSSNYYGYAYKDPDIDYGFPVLFTCGHNTLYKWMNE